MRSAILQCRSPVAVARWLLPVALAVLALPACTTRPVPDDAAPVEAGSPAETCYQSPWLDSEACRQPVISKVPYASLKQDLVKYLDEQKQGGALQEAGVYFRDLEDGPHFGVNEYATFAAASLFKLPVVIQYLFLAEQDPSLLAERLVVPGSDQVLHEAYLQRTASSAWSRKWTTASA